MSVLLAIPSIVVMATDHQRTGADGGRPRRVVLRGKQQQHMTLDDDGAEIKATKSDTESKPSMSLIAKSHDDKMATWGSAPLINDVDSDTCSPLGRDENHRMHLSPEKSTAVDTENHDLLRQDESSPRAHASINRPESSSEEEERETERESRVETGNSHSDDVFLDNSPTHLGAPINLSQNDPKMACSRSHEDVSKLDEWRLQNDQLPPLPASRRRRQRPYTSLGRNSSSCSTDSYTSPIHNRSQLPSTTGSQPSAVRRLPQKSGKGSRKSGKRSSRVHPEDNHPQTVKVPSPLQISSTAFTPLTSMNKRTLSSTDSMSSTLSSTLTPLLTCSLRKGGGYQRPSSSSAWEFDAEAQLESCFPDRHMQVLVVTWNMQQIKVGFKSIVTCALCILSIAIEIYK